MDQNRRLILFAHPRSGSSSLYEILQLHPALNILEEPFNENFTQWDPANVDYLSRIHDITSIDAQLDEILATYNGVKVLHYQLPQELTIHLLQRRDYFIIFLRRRNLLQAVVSGLIAEQTNLWKKWDMVKPLEGYYRNLQPLDLDEVRQRILWLKDDLALYESVIDARPDQTAIKLIYEELYFAPLAERDAQVAAIWRKLGLAPLPFEPIQHYLQPESVKINSAATYAWLPNAQEVERTCGNDVTGWLFDG